MANPRIAAHTPPVCSGCYAQYPGRVHIDFASAIEGGLIDPENPRGGHVDWVVLCEECVRGAHALLPQPDADLVEGLQADLGRAVAAAAAAEDYAASLEAAIAKRPAEREHQHPKVTPAKKPAARKPRYGAQS